MGHFVLYKIFSSRCDAARNVVQLIKLNRKVLYHVAIFAVTKILIKEEETMLECIVAASPM